MEEEPNELETKIPDNPDEREQAAREAAACPKVAGIVSDVIDRLVAARWPINDFPERAGPSGTYHPPPSPVPARGDSSESDKTDAEAHAGTSRKRKRLKNPFILDEAAEDNDEGELDTDDTDDDEFI